MRVYSVDTDELLGDLDVEDMTDVEILESLEDSDYISSTVGASIQHGANGDLYVTVDGARVLNLSYDECDGEDEEDEDEEDDEFEDADD